MDPLRSSLGPDEPIVRWGLLRLENILRALAGERPVAEPELEADRRPRSVDYLGPDLTVEETADVRRYIDFVLHSRR